MVDFGYYVNSYLGNLIPEKAFAPLAARGEAALQRLQRIYHVVGGEDSKALWRELYQAAGIYLDIYRGVC